jgi:CRP/FNR family transcriptional regulator, cyclic AMP receptor protein
MAALSSAPDLSVLPGALRALAARGTLRSYRKGTLIIEEGTQGDSLYLLLAGRVKAFSSDARGREITYGLYGIGEYFGEMSLDGGQRSASVMAVEVTLCVVVTRQTLRDHIAEQPDFAFELISHVIARARRTTERARTMALLDVYGRLAQLLASMAAEVGDGNAVIRDKLTHAQLASHVGCSREMISRLMKDLQLGGYVAVERGVITLLKPLPQRW